MITMVELDKSAAAQLKAKRVEQLHECREQVLSPA